MVWVQIDPFTTVNACLKKLLLPCVCCFLSHTAKTLQNHNWSVPVMFIGQQQHCKQILHLLTYCHRKSASVRAHKLMILFLKGNQYYYQVERVSVHRNAYCSIDCLLDFFHNLKLQLSNCNYVPVFTWVLENWKQVIRIQRVVQRAWEFLSLYSRNRVGRVLPVEKAYSPSSH